MNDFVSLQQLALISWLMSGDVFALLPTRGSMQIDWLSPTGDAVKLATPTKHQIDMRVVEEYWDTEQTDVGIWPDKYLVVARPKTFDPGSIVPMGSADTKSEYVVYYFAGYRSSQTLWEIDKRNMKCIINGKDYMADVRKALGK